jgi:hypothetical protein
MYGDAVFYGFMGTILLISGGMLVKCFIDLRRNDKVHDYRIYLINRIQEAVEADIANNRPWEWRLEVYRSVSYNDMMKHWSVPLDKFYPDKSFINPRATGPEE